jgi:hypothetical protein
MPVTARLSRKFYERLGEDIAQEFVDWFNMVDATYRQDLRETNKLNFARFDAKLEQRITTLDAKLEQSIATLDAKWEQRTAKLDAKWEVRLSEQTAQLLKEIAATRADLIKWMFVFWSTTALAVIGLATRVL